MYSADFLRRFAELQRQQTNQASAEAVDATVETGESTDPVEQGQAMIGSRPSSYANTQPGTVDAIVYNPVNGKAYPNPSVAALEGVTNFSYQIPSGMNIDWSYWDRFAQPEPTPPPPASLSVADQTLPFEAPEPSPTPATAPRPQPQPQPQPAPQPAPQRSSQPSPPPPPPAPPPPPQPAPIASRSQWENQGTYMHGPGHSGPNSGKSLKGDRNNNAYYDNYVRAMNEANKSGNTAQANEINRAHSLLQKR